MKTVLIVAHECAPYHRPGSTIGAQRPFQFAKHLRFFGWRPIIICRNFKQEGKATGEWRTAIEKQVTQGLEREKNDDLLYFSLPSLPSANRVDKIWREAVKMDEEKGTFSPLPGIDNYLKRKIATLLKLRTGDYSQNWIEVALYAAKVINSQTKVDVVLAEHGPNASLFVASRIHHQTMMPWVIDFRDPLDRDLKPLQRKIFNFFLPRTVLSCARVINVNDYWTSIEVKRFQVPGRTIYNGFDEAEFDKPTIVQDNSSTLTIGYFGTIQKPQNITPFIQALSQLENTSNVKFIYRGNSCRYLQQIAESQNISRSLYELGEQVSREKILELYQTCDILLLLSLQDDRDIYFKKGLHPGKTFEYFGAKKSILVVPGDNGMLDDLIVSTHSGTIGRTSKQIVELLTEAMKNKRERSTIFNFNPSLERIQFFTRKNQTRLLAELLDEVIHEG